MSDDEFNLTDHDRLMLELVRHLMSLPDKPSEPDPEPVESA